MWPRLCCLQSPTLTFLREHRHGQAPVDIALSVVSHGHGNHVLQLLEALAQTGCRRVWLTLNVPEPAIRAALGPAEPTGYCTRGSLQIHVIENLSPLGFGANHNQAFAREMRQPAPAACFGVLNPDLAWTSDPLPALVAAAGSPGAGCAFPHQTGADGQVQDHRRRVPTPGALLRRHVFRQPEVFAANAAPHWVNAAMLVFPASVYAQVGGFDESYFMYCEDVDLCLRLQLAGYRLVEAPQAVVTHQAQRASRRNLRHTLWHLRSLCRLWASGPYARFLTQQSTTSKG